MAIRILVVDDDEIERFMVLRFFRNRAELEDVVVDEAESGEEAIEMMKAKSFDCIISDYRMGAVTGFDVLAFAMEHRPEMIRILFSGFASPELERQAIAVARPHAVLEKPMTPGELEALLQTQVVGRFLHPLLR